ncbi:MAG: DegQ family serine endoprotease [Deltaproteobacteria bacterium]|nr:DegQ family serine endoprotease [Deltaproteobacteria bacterium]
MKRQPTLFFYFALVFNSLFLIHTALAADFPNFAELSTKIKPSVVNIRTSKTVQRQRPNLPGPHDDLFNEFFERFFEGIPNTPRRERSLGSGFIISEDGLILTNDHVVDNADEIKVRLADGRIFKGKVQGLDPKLDLALLKIDVGDEELPVAKLGDSESLRIGEWVIAIGNPFGLEQTVTVGIVSAKGRVIGAGPYDDFIQTDASINPGNSGGPLFNINGEVIGINTAIVQGGQGIGFAIPINAAKNIVPQLREKGKVTRGWLGVTVQEVSEDLGKSFGLEEAEGALVSEVAPGSPAANAGIKRGDIILSFKDQKIKTLSDLPRLVAASKVGESVKLTVFRDGVEKTFSVKLGELDEEKAQVVASGDPEKKFGLSLLEVTPETIQRYALKNNQGVLITRVDPAGPGASANLRPGDLILEINNTETPDLGTFLEATKQIKKDQIVRLLVQRGSYLSYTTIKAN